MKYAAPTLNTNINIITVVIVWTLSSNCFTLTSICAPFTPAGTIPIGEEGRGQKTPTFIILSRCWEGRQPGCKPPACPPPRRTVRGESPSPSRRRTSPQCRSCRSTCTSSIPRTSAPRWGARAATPRRGKCPTPPGRCGYDRPGSDPS
jgi:hypothetical protein